MFITENRFFFLFDFFFAIMGIFLVKRKILYFSNTRNSVLLSLNSLFVTIVSNETTRFHQRAKHP